MARTNHGNPCERCGQILTADNQKGERTLSSLCDVCDWHDRDDLAYLTGTGRWGQG